ncbi:nuclear transport factor 2 family protein [Kribbella sp. NPDC050820]|uniref:YybH family protein n=1 Tax=Kribbella sp. NPDC050820 TaxID=3155408 RepID=UPI003404BAD0
MSQSFETFLREYERANTAFVNGDVSLWLPLVSRSEQTSIFGGFGGLEVGWSQVGPRYEWAAAQFRPSAARVEFEYLEKHVSTDTAYYVAIERCTVEYVHRPEPIPHVLRATMVFRREDGDWKIAHRHADPLGPASPPAAS